MVQLFFGWRIKLLTGSIFLSMVVAVCATVSFGEPRLTVALLPACLLANAQSWASRRPSSAGSFARSWSSTSSRRWSSSGSRSPHSRMSSSRSCSASTSCVTARQQTWCADVPCRGSRRRALRSRTTSSRGSRDVRAPPGPNRTGILTCAPVTIQTGAATSIFAMVDLITFVCSVRAGSPPAPRAALTAARLRHPAYTWHSTCRSRSCTRTRSSRRSTRARDPDRVIRGAVTPAAAGASRGGYVPRVPAHMRIAS
jgi:hypothetical protein